ncbi:MAG: collagen-like protein [Bacteroidota bacterium]
MKYIVIISSFLLLSIGCEGPQGPQGPIGPAAPEGGGFVFEFEDIDFTSPFYDFFLQFDDFEVVESDVALVYFLWDIAEDNNGNPVEIWRLLPQQVFHPNGLLNYNFDFGVTDVRLFLDANFDLNTLSAEDTDDWVARVVIIPDFPNSRVDLRDYNAVIEHFNLKELQVRSLVKERRPIE